MPISKEALELAQNAAASVRYSPGNPPTLYLTGAEAAAITLALLDADKEIAGLRAAFVSGKITANDTRRRPLVFTGPDIDSVERSDRPLPFELPGIYL